jgi:hypothetical protein
MAVRKKKAHQGRKTKETQSKRSTSKRKSPQNAKSRSRSVPVSQHRERSATPEGTMKAPASGVKVRMYRQGHGDCFLLAFRGKDDKAVYVLIDCGCKPGSNGRRFKLKSLRDAVQDIRTATGGHLDLVVITHEHQDHVNGFEPYFQDFTIQNAWFAWTEDPKDDVANELRQRYHDQLLGLVAARNGLAAAGASHPSVNAIDELLSLELGLDRRMTRQALRKAAVDKKAHPEKSANKRGMSLVKKKAGTRNTRFLRPHEHILHIPRVDDVRVFVLGPPRSADLIADEEPQGSEAFPGQAVSLAYASFAAAAAQADHNVPKPDILPFARHFAIPLDSTLMPKEYVDFFDTHYGKTPAPQKKDKRTKRGNPKRIQKDDWRRIDGDWLYSAEDLALQVNKGINNTSLVLAFELQKSRKVLLFVGDAQRGNWKSWTDGSWKDDGKGANVIEGTEITVRDLMSRTVLYKVGHHGSHNATLNGTSEDTYPNLAWMGQGRYGSEFTAMITAVSKWAHEQEPPWNHPLESIKTALQEKADGRVLQTDKNVKVSAKAWKNFKGKDQRKGKGKGKGRGKDKDESKGLYFEYDILDEPY